MTEECCEREASRTLLELYPNRNDVFGLSMVDYLKKVAHGLGELGKQTFDAYMLRTIDDPGFLNANIIPIQCPNGHKNILIIIGTRLYYFIWRTNMLVASAFDMDESGELGASLAGDWPTSKESDELAECVLQYFGISDLVDTDFGKFNSIVFNSHPAATLMQTEIVNMAEMFVLFHEIQHTIPVESRALHVDIQADSAIPDDRREEWYDELQADADGMYLLWVAATKANMTKFSLSMQESKAFSAILVFGGADAALNAVESLELVRHGVVPEDRWIEPAFQSHPPASFRRKLLSQVGVKLAQQNLSDNEWTDVRKNIGAVIQTRQLLIDKFFTERGDIVSEVRAI